MATLLLLGRRVLLGCCLVAALGAPAMAQEVFVMGTTRPDTDFAGKWMRRIYGEAFRRAGVPLQVAVYPTQRLSLVLLEGGIDGEMARAYGYGVQNPQLVRVEEPAIDTVFALFGGPSAQRLQRLEDLPSSGLSVAYARGVAECEVALARWLPAQRIVDVNTTEQGLAMIQAGRVDLVCGLDFLVLPMLKSSALRGSGITTLLELGKPTPLYAYVHPRRASLAPALAGALRQMKAEGLIERYRAELLRELGQQ
jgi:ABC-type amino acid transport substrate-binding protein